MEQYVEYVTATIGGQLFGLPIAGVQDVFVPDRLTSVPLAPPEIAGVLNVRGRILAVVDIKKFFDLPEQGMTDAHKLLLVQTEDMELGILADTVAGVRSIPLDTIQTSLPTLTGLREEYLKGVTAERLVILDAARILGDRRIIVHEDVEA